MKKVQVSTYKKTMKAYRITGITNETNTEIIDFCDPYNFGGYVTRYTNGVAFAYVYID